MKKVISVILSLLMLTTLASCITKTSYYHNYEESITEKIEIIYIDRDKDRENKSLVYPLTNEEISECLLALSKIEFGHVFIGTTPTYPNRYCLKITFNDGKYVIIGTGGAEFYAEDGTLEKWNYYRCSKEDFDNLIAKFISVS